MYTASVDGWVVKHAVDDGRFTYKFVVDGVWIADPANPLTEDDGFGAVNSVLVSACAGAAPPERPSPSAAFPVESRPQHYPFDNAAESGIVTTVHVEQYDRAAVLLAAAAVIDAWDVVGCDPVDDACVDGWLRSFGRRAFRRPLTEAEVDRYRALIDGSGLPGAVDRTAGVGTAIRAFLQSPWFLYRVESGALDPGTGAYALDDWELASELSYLVWGAPPDDALLDAAEAGLLVDPDGREAAARRMLADPRARDQLGAFAVQWLGVDEVPDAVRSTELYPDWSPALAASMVAETAAYAGWVAFDGPGRYRDLLAGDTVVVDPLLAGLYGVSQPEPGFAAVPAPLDRRGILGQAAVLTATAHSDQTSPVQRGVLVRERLLCQTFGPPPAAAGGVPAVDPGASTRERYAQHASDPACASCHALIDPVGFGLEGFDPIGATRATDAGWPIDASGEVAALGSPTAAPIPFDGEPALAEILAGSDAGRRCFATQVRRYAVGGLETDADDCAIDQLETEFGRTGGALVELWVSLVRSDTFGWRSP
ncbi:MAG: DUF1592 domain-containing protein [Myxococcota bacterium]